MGICGSSKNTNGHSGYTSHKTENTHVQHKTPAVENKEITHKAVEPERPVEKAKNNPQPQIHAFTPISSMSRLEGKFMII